MNPVAFLLPDTDQLLGFFAVLATLSGFAVIGGALGGKNRFAAADIFVGWGVASAAFTLGGVFGSIPFTSIAAGLSIALIPALGVCRKNIAQGGSYPGDCGNIWKVLLLALPVLMLVTAMKASQWDEFAHWLPNSQYIFRHDGFPGGQMPPIRSAHPAYPYGLPIITYLASKLSSHFIENGSAIANVALHIVLAPVYISMISHGLRQSPTWSHRWGVAALGVLGVTVFSTTFVQKLIFTAYADATTSVVLAVVGVLGWKILDALTSHVNAAQARSLAWQFAWSAIVLLSIKQSNLSLFGILLLGIAIVAMLDKQINAIKLFKLLPIMVIPGMIIYLSWRYHVGATMPGGEHVILPFAQWHLSEAWSILANMFGVATLKGAFFVMMLAISIAAIINIGQGQSEFARLGLITMIVFICFNLFLWFVYISTFELSNSLNVISYWRFNTQLGLLGCTTAAYGLAILWRKRVDVRTSGSFMFSRLLPGLAVVLVVAMPLLATKTLRFDIRPQKDHIRMAGQEMAHILPQNARLKVIDPNGNGLTTVITRYELTNGVAADKNIDVPAGFDNYRNGVLSLDPLQDTSLTHAWVFQPTDMVKDIITPPLSPGSSHLLEKQDGAWRIIKSWPYKTFDNPYNLQD